MLRRVLSLIWTIILITQVCFLANAQTIPNPLQDEVDQAEARARIANAKKEELEAKFPAPDADALKGSTDVKGELIESRIQAYKAMVTICQKIAGDAKTKGIRVLYVYRDEDYAKIVSYRKLIQRLDIINDQYDHIYPLPLVPPAWNTFTVWQYIDGNSGDQPYQIPGIGRCDRQQIQRQPRRSAKTLGRLVIELTLFKVICTRFV